MKEEGVERDANDKRGGATCRYEEEGQGLQHCLATLCVRALLLVFTGQASHITPPNPLLYPARSNALLTSTPHAL